jgi:peptidyl-prolyl cis-trans isomerase C
LGSFEKGEMVKSFDKAVFSGPLNQVLGPVKTQFGYHLIKVSERWD